MKLKTNIILMSLLVLSSCVENTQENKYTVCGNNLNSAELKMVGPPTFDMGNGNIGLYTAKTDTEPAKYSLLNCKSLEFTQIRSKDSLAKLKEIVDLSVKNGDASSTGRFAEAMTHRGDVPVIRSEGVRTKVSRYVCGCTTFYPHDWYWDTPGDYIANAVVFD